MKNIKNFSYNFIKYFAMGLAFTLISFLFRSCEVKAENFLKPAAFIYSNTEVSVSQITFRGDIYFKQTTWDNTTLTNKLLFRYDTSSFDSSKNYDFSGLIFLNQFESSVSYGYLPIITWNSTICDTYVDQGYWTGVDQDVFGYIVGFKCNNVAVNGNDYLNVLYTRSILRVGSYISRLNYIDSYESSSSKTLTDINDNITNGNKIQEDTNKTIKDDSVDTSSSNSFFNNFSNNGHGLTGVINAPLSFIQSLSNNSCSPVNFTIPFVNETFKLPCFSSIYKENFNVAYTIYQVVITALVGYWVCVKIYAMVKGFKDPTDDRIEVMDL